MVRVRVVACGVCLTEVHGIDGLLGERRSPQVLGHEFGGVIDAAGPDVGGLQVGMVVGCVGVGGFAQYVAVPASDVVRLPAGVAAEYSAFLEPIACCAAAVERAHLPFGASVLVTGAGPMGLLVLQLALRGGATKVLVSEPNPNRRSLARQLGARLAVDPGDGQLRAGVAELTGGRGVDVAFETAGQPAPLADCLEAVSSRGTAVMVGVQPTAARLDLDLYRFHRREARLIASYGPGDRGNVQTAADWLSQLDLASLVSHRIPLVDIAEAFAVAREGSGLKVLVDVAHDTPPNEGPSPRGRSSPTSIATAPSDATV